MSEVKAIETLDKTLGTLDPDERARVLGWAQQKYGTLKGGPGPALSHVHPATAPAPAATARAKGSKKPAKTVLSMDKSLNLSPSGKESAAQFGEKKSPSNVKEKCVVAVYYLRDVIGMEKVSVQAVFTYFKHLKWPVPADLKNTLQQAGSDGWLDTASAEDIKLTSLGENLVEHDLPAKTKATPK
jgi:hypothetical protein